MPTACETRISLQLPGSYSFYSFILINFFFSCHETSLLQHVALRRIASLASCIPDLFRGLKKVRDGDKAKEVKDMPNWCSTNITIHSDKENELKNLYEKIKLWTSKDYMENGFGHTWLGNIVLGAEIGTVDTDVKTDVRCRGNIVYMDYQDGQIVIDTETAWVPMLDIWRKVLEKFLPDAQLFYVADEPGCELHCSNDAYYNNLYYVDAFDFEEDVSQYDASPDYVIKLLQRLLKSKETNIDTLLSLFYESDYADNINIHKWEYDDGSNW